MTIRTLSGHFLLVALALSSIQDLRAGWSGLRYAQVRWPPRLQNAYGPPQTSTNASTRQTKPTERPRKFKDLSLNTVFYAWTDRQQKRFPWVKITETSAKAGTDPKAAKAQVVPVRPELQVFVEKPPPKDTTPSKVEKDKDKKT